MNFFAIYQHFCKEVMNYILSVMVDNSICVTTKRKKISIVQPLKINVF